MKYDRDAEDVVRGILEESMRGTAQAVKSACPDCRGTGTVPRSNGVYVRCGKCYGTRWTK